MRGGLTSPNPIPAISGSSQPCENSRVCCSPVQGLHKPRLLTPVTFSIFSLALAVALWGYGYKLSLYHRHPVNVSVNQVAKLWVKEQGGVGTGLRAGAPTDRSQELSGQPPSPHAVALNVLLAPNSCFEQPLYQVPIEFDLLSRPPPSYSSL